MTAQPINDNLSYTVHRMLFDIGGLDSVALRHVVATSIGLLYDKMGPLHTGKIICHIMDQCRDTERPLTLHEVCNLIAQKHQIKAEDLKRPYVEIEGHNPYEHSYARQEAFWLARKQKRPDGKPVFSLKQIGKFFGGRDHTTVHHGIKQHDKRLFGGVV